MEIGSENSFKVLPTPLKPLYAIPPPRMTRYEKQPMAMAALTSDSGAGSVMGEPSVVIA